MIEQAIPPSLMLRPNDHDVMSLYKQNEQSTNPFKEATSAKYLLKSYPQCSRLLKTPLGNLDLSQTPSPLHPTPYLVPTRKVATAPLTR